MKWTSLALITITASSLRCHGDQPPVGSEQDAGQVDQGRDFSSPGVDGAADMAASCGDDGVELYEVAGWTVSLDHDTGAWHATPLGSDEPLLSGPPSCSIGGALSVTDVPPEIRSAFANFRIDLPAADQWQANPPGELPVFEGSNDDLRLVFQTGSLVFTEGPKGGLRIDVEQDLPTADFRVACRPEEAFFGLGTQAVGMDLRGRTYPLWTQEQGNGKPEGGGTFPFANIPEAAYAPMGVLHSTAGWSAVVTHDGFTEVDLCHEEADWLAIRSHEANPGFVFLPGTPRDRVTAVTRYTGRVRSDVPDWAFGLWVDSVTGPDRLATVTGTLRAEGIPASAIWSEDWIGGESSSFGFRLSYDWIWDSEHYPMLPMLVDDLHARGFAFLGYFNTFVPEPTTIWPEAVAGGYLVEDAMGQPVVFLDPAFRNAGLVDLYDFDALEWLRGYQVTAVNDLGMDGWMADFSEWYPLGGVDAWARHNPYTLLWQQANDANMREVRPDGNYIFFPRSGWASIHGGSGGITPVMWGGDQNTDWSYEDGFPTVIPIGAHVGLSGVPIFGSDIAGYNTVGQVENTTKELWFRWAAVGALHPLMRTHHGGDECNNWNFDRDSETLEHLRRWSSIHSLLLPEFRRLLEEASNLGWPISRHPWLVEPDAPALWSGDGYAWFLGDDLFVAPVLTEGATTREVTLPGSGWWPLFGDAPVAADTESANVPVSDMAVYVRPGRALVLLGDSVDSFYGATAPTVTDLDDTRASFRVALYASAAGMATTPGEVPFALGARGLDGFDPSASALNGTPLTPCVAGEVVSCVDGEVIRLRGVSAASLTVGAATVDIDSPAPIDLQVGIAGAVWGALADGTGYTPNPDAPGWCPPETP